MLNKIELRKAERKQAKIRVGVFGPSGSGKSMSALKMAHGMAPWEKICVIDTENGSADLYSHLGSFNVITIAPPYDPEKYVQAMQTAVNAGMEVIIVDSISHEWDGTGGMLEIADAMAIQMKDGRLAWNKVTPRHNKYIDSIKFSQAHVICCGRSKQEKVVNKREAGGITAHDAERIGLKAVTREGFEYEMTVVFDLSINHYATCSKDRTTDPADGKALFQDRPPMIISEEVGARLKAWSESGAIDFSAIKSNIMKELKRIYWNEKLDTKEQVAKFVHMATEMELVESNYQAIYDKLQSIFVEFPDDDAEIPVENIEQVAPVEPESEELVSANKLNVIREIAKTKGLAQDDVMLKSFINFITSLNIESLETMTVSQSNIVYKELLGSVSEQKS